VTATLEYSTATVADLDVGGLSGKGMKVTTPVPWHGRLNEVGIALATPYFRKLTWPGPVAAGGGGPKNALIEVASFPVYPMVEAVLAAGTTSTLWPETGWPRCASGPGHTTRMTAGVGLPGDPFTDPAND
jgi:hypothetical protein